MSGRIDTHHHIVPPEYAALLAKLGLNAAGFPIPSWTIETALATMDAHDVATAILSVSTPGAHLGDDTEARVWARKLNDHTAEVVKERPDRFGFFATLTLPDVDGALAELAYAFDELHADGVVLLANVHGTYLGDPAFEPVMAELDRRHAVVFVHPSHLPGPALATVPPFMADFLLDTTRAALNLTLSGTMDRCPNLRVILSHAGGFLPYAAYRFAPFCSPDGSHDGGIARLRRFWFDTALSSSASALPSLQQFADPERILFGSDWPYAPTPAVTYFAGNLDSIVSDPVAHRRICRTNAEQLFPRLAAVGGH
jgi:6-methylsalicylate decarboxylase